MWRPARTQLYAVLPRLESDGLRQLAHAHRPQGDPTSASTGSPSRVDEALDAWLTTIEPGAENAFFLKLFVGGLASIESSIAQVETFRAEVETRLAVLRAIEPTNTRTGHDRFHYFLLRLGIERQEHLLRWCDWVLEELTG